MDLFNEAEASADPEAEEPCFEEIHPSSYKRKKRTGKKEEDLSGFEVTETIEYKLAGEDRYCPDCGKKAGNDRHFDTKGEVYLLAVNEKSAFFCFPLPTPYPFGLPADYQPKRQ